MLSLLFLKNKQIKKVSKDTLIDIASQYCNLLLKHPASSCSEKLEKKNVAKPWQLICFYLQVFVVNLTSGVDIC